MFEFLKKRREQKAEAAATAARNAAAYEEGRRAAEAVVAALDGFMDSFVDPWADQMISIFTHRVAVEVIFGDDPAPDARAELAKFNLEVDAQLASIKSDIRSRLRYHEQVGIEFGMHEQYENLLKSRFDQLRLDMTLRGMNLAADVVMARNVELGIECEEGEAMENGRRILAEVRAKPISLST